MRTPPARRGDELARQGLLLLAFDLLVGAVVAQIVGIMFPSTFPTVTAIVLATGGVLAVVAALITVRYGRSFWNQWWA